MVIPFSEPAGETHDIDNENRGSRDSTHRQTIPRVSSPFAIDDAIET